MSKKGQVEAKEEPVIQTENVIGQSEAVEQTQVNEPLTQAQIDANAERKQRTKERLIQIVFPEGKEAVKTHIVEIADAYGISNPDALMLALTGQQKDAKQAWETAMNTILDYKVDPEVAKELQSKKVSKPMGKVTVDKVKNSVLKLSPEKQQELIKEMMEMLKNKENKE